MDQNTKVAQQIPSILLSAADHLRESAETSIELVKRAESAEHELRVMKLARRMEIRGLHPNLDFESKVAQLLEIPIENLAATEQAVEMAAGGVRLAKVAEEVPEAKTAGYSQGTDPDILDTFIMNQEAYANG